MFDGFLSQSANLSKTYTFTSFAPIVVGSLLQNALSENHKQKDHHQDRGQRAECDKPVTTLSTVCNCTDREHEDEQIGQASRWIDPGGYRSTVITAP